MAWPVDDSDEQLTVELSGLPVFDRDRNFRGYRGFGVCRDLARLAALAPEFGSDIATELPAHGRRGAFLRATSAENGVPLPAVAAGSEGAVLEPGRAPRLSRACAQAHRTSEPDRHRGRARSRSRHAITKRRRLLRRPFPIWPKRKTAPSPARPSAHGHALQADKDIRRAIRFSRPGQPRDPHAAQHHYRLLRGDDGGTLRARRQRSLPAISQRHPQFRRPPGRADRRPSRPLQDRSGQARAHFTGVAINDLVAQCVATTAAAGEPGAYHHPQLAVAEAAAGRRRRALGAPDCAEPISQLYQVHGRGRTCHRLDRSHRSRRSGVARARQQRRHERDGNRGCHRTVQRDRDLDPLRVRRAPTSAWL